MKVLTQWLRSYLPELPVPDAQLAEDLTLRGIAVDGVFDLTARHGTPPAGGADSLSARGSLFEMDITTNRVDAMNHYGIAREAATIYGLALGPIDAALPASTPAAPFPVRIEAPNLCGRFTARVLRGVIIGSSSGPVAERFRLLEQKQISNAVDATNYVTLAIGQPTHVFDLDKVVGGIVVRRARKGERLKTLDGVERTLDPEDLVVADEQRALGIAGVMGGWDTMITPETRNVLVEAAWFNPASVRRSSKRHGLHTDASHRFERGADFNAAPLASAMVSRIILEAGGTVEGELVDIVVPEAEARTARRPAVTLALGEVRRILGPTEAPEGITAGDVRSILTGLGCGLAPAGQQQGEQQILRSAQDDSALGAEAESAGQRFTVTLPSWRLDLEREIDLIEEVARVYGYNRFRNTIPGFAGSVVEQPTARKEWAVRQTLLASGYSEALSSTFCAAADAALFAPQPASAVPMGNPLSEEAGMLRPSLLPGMLAMLALNLNRGVDAAALFEMGTVFSGSTERVDEWPALSFGAYGADVDFYALKGLVETVADRFAARAHYCDRVLMPAWLHPGRSARLVVDGSTVAFFGQLHPELAHNRKLKQAVYLGEVYLHRLYRQGLRHPMMRELSRYQPVRRDFSFLFPETVTYAAIDSALKGLGLPELVHYSPDEVLHDTDAKLVPTGHYSLLLAATFQSNERTLRDEDLQGYSQAVVQAVERVGGRLRG